jgi:phage terminase large subunit
MITATMINNYRIENVVVPRNKVFRDISRSTARYRIWKGGAGSGKSTDIAIGKIKKLSDPRFKGCNLLCVRKVNASNRDSTFVELKKAARRIFGDIVDRVWQFPDGRNASLYAKCLVTGAEILFRGCYNQDDIEKIKSVTFEQGNLTDIWIEEATEITENDFEILDDRLRGILRDGLFYQIDLSFNPVPSWIKKRFFDMPDKNAFICESTYKDNRFIDKAFSDRMEERRIRDPEGFRIYGAGQWGQLGGIIFNNWEVREFDTTLFNVRSYGQDFGFNHPNVLLDLGFKDGNIYICREMTRTGVDTNEIIRDANMNGWKKNIEMWCDSAEPDRIKMWRAAGYNAKPVSKEKNSIKGQIEWLKGIVSKTTVVNRRIYIHPDCVNTIKEIQQYRWKHDAKENIYLDEPVDFFDDHMAALRYGIERLRKPQGYTGF